MKQRLLELVTNDDGKLSRTQVMLWGAFIFALGITLADVVMGNILTWKVLAVLAGLHLFSLLDRIQAKYAAIRISQHGADLSLGADTMPDTSRPEAPAEQ